jgi:hypothetical protein
VRFEARGLESRALDAVDAVGDDPKPESAPELAKRRAAPRKQVAAFPEAAKERGAQRSGTALVGAQLSEQAPKALARQDRRADLAPAILLPQLVVDAAIFGQQRAGERELEACQGGFERPPLGAVEVQERVVQVEEDCPGARQERKAYLARYVMRPRFKS